MTNKAIVNYFKLHPFVNFEVSDLGSEIIIEPNTRFTFGNRPDYFDGMQIIYYAIDGIFEVSEYQAGSKENELHIYYETKSIKRAFNKLMLGNKQKPIKVWK